MLQPSLDARAARGAHVTQHERLGDDVLNASNGTHRHNAALHALAHALRAGAPAGAVQLGDKGDGTPASKANARAATRTSTPATSPTSSSATHSTS